MTKETLSNLYGIRRHCINSIQEAEARGRRTQTHKYRDQLGKINSLIEGLGVSKDSWLAADPEEARVKLSARNQIPGTVVEVHVGAVNATIKLDIGNGNVVTSSITNEAVEELSLAVGDQVSAVIKATDVIIGK
jgi:molybdopterin-binding protein